MAEYLGRRFYPTIQFRSAGLVPEDPGDTEYAVETLSRFYGIDASAHTPRKVNGEMLNEADIIVPLGENVSVYLKDEFHLDVLAHPVKDPWGTKSIPHYKLCAEDIEDLLRKLFGPKQA